MRLIRGVVLGGGGDARGTLTPWDGDDGGEELRRQPWAKHRGLCLLSPPQLSVAASAERHPSPETLAPHSRATSGLPAPPGDLDAADPLGPHLPPVRHHDAV